MLTVWSSWEDKQDIMTIHLICQRGQWQWTVMTKLSWYARFEPNKRRELPCLNSLEHCSTYQIWIRNTRVEYQQLPLSTEPCQLEDISPNSSSTQTSRDIKRPDVGSLKLIKKIAVITDREFTTNIHCSIIFHHIIYWIYNFAPIKASYYSTMIVSQVSDDVEMLVGDEIKQTHSASKWGPAPNLTHLCLIWWQMVNIFLTFLTSSAPPSLVSWADM